MKTIAIFNQKGGVAKTATSINLANCLANEGQKVLLVDIDGQSNATKNLNRYNPQKLSICDLLLKKDDIDVIDVIQDTEIENLDILPSSIQLIKSENIIANETFSRESKLKKILKNITDDYDYCIIDCPPNLGIYVSNALVAATHVITPVKIDQYALEGFQNLTEAIEEVKEELNPNLEFMGVLVTMDKSTTINRDIKELLKEQLPNKLFKTSIRENVDVVKSTFSGMPVISFNPNARASKDYINFTKEVLNYGK